MTTIPLSTPAQVGATVRGARTRAGITQTELASRAGVSRRWLIALEAGNGQRAELGKVLDTLDAVGLALSATDGASRPNPLAELLDDL